MPVIEHGVLICVNDQDIDADGKFAISEEMARQITTIGKHAFANCEKLKELDLSRTQLKAIDKNSFYVFKKRDQKHLFNGFKNLKKIVLPGTIESIEPDAFAFCEYLEELDLSRTQLNETPKALCYRSIRLNKILLPSTIKVINATAFAHCENLEELDLSHTQIKEIAAVVFSDCKKLNKIVLPGTIEVIEASAFSGCNSLEELNLSHTQIKKMGNRSFAYCKNLKKIRLPATIEVIEEFAFSDCNSLEELDLGHTQLKEIGPYSFRSCINLNTIVLPGTIESIGVYPFAYCKNLEHIFIKTDNKEIFEKIKALIPAHLKDRVTMGEPSPDSLKKIREERSRYSLKDYFRRAVVVTLSAIAGIFSLGLLLLRKPKHKVDEEEEISLADIFDGQPPGMFSFFNRLVMERRLIGAEPTYQDFMAAGIPKGNLGKAKRYFGIE